MRHLPAAPLTASVGIALVAAQDVAPGWPGFHGWQYAGALLVIVALLGLGLANAARSVPRALIDAGALVVVAAGLSSGLLGADTETVSRPPGSVAPLPDWGFTAVFPEANAAGIAGGRTPVLVRRENGGEITVAGSERRFIGGAAVTIQQRPAAFIEAWDLRGNRLTITQPSGGGFLSPVLLFPGSIPLEGIRQPTDAFATPAVRRQIKAVLFGPETANPKIAAEANGKPAVLFAVAADDAPAGQNRFRVGPTQTTVEVGGVRLRATVGSYPALRLSAVPLPLALWAGGCTFVLGLVASVRGPKFRPQAQLAATASIVKSP